MFNHLQFQLSNPRSINAVKIIAWSLAFVALGGLTMTNVSKASQTHPVKTNKNASVYGDPISKACPTMLGDAVSAMEKENKKISNDICVRGKVESVCKKKGCWLQLVDGKTSVKVKFKNYGFFVPLSLRGKSIQAAGQLELTKVTVAERRHLLEDAGASKAEIEKITSPSIELRFEASGLALAKR